MANIYSLKSGLASDPTVWSGGVVPAAGDRVLIDSGHVVELDGTYEWGDDSTATISINGFSTTRSINVRGTLKHSRSVSSQLTCRGNFAVLTGGWHDIGTEADPIPGSISVTLLLNRSASMAVNKYGYLTQDNSRFTAWGATRRRATRLTAPITAGATSINVEAADGWQPGDTLILAHTDTTAANRQDFVVIAAGYTPGALTVPLTAATSFAHASGGVVGNYKSNVNFASYSDSFVAYGMNLESGATQSANTREIGYVTVGNFGTVFPVYGLHIAMAANYSATPNQQPWRAMKGIAIAKTSTSAASLAGILAYLFSSRDPVVYEDLLVVFLLNSGSVTPFVQLGSHCRLVRPTFIGTLPLLNGDTDVTYEDMTLVSRSRDFLYGPTGGGNSIVLRRLKFGGYGTSGDGALLTAGATTKLNDVLYDDCDFGVTYPMPSTPQLFFMQSIDTRLSMIAQDCVIAANIADPTLATMGNMTNESYVRIVNRNKDVTQQEEYRRQGVYRRDNINRQRGASSISMRPNFVGLACTRAQKIACASGKTLRVVGYAKMDSAYYNGGDCNPPTVTLSGLGLAPVVFTATMNTSWQKFDLSITNTAGYDGEISLTFSATPKTVVGGLVNFDGVADAPFVTKVRHYGFMFDESSPVRTVNPIVQASEAAVAGYTGVTIDPVEPKITVAGGSVNTWRELYDAYQYWAVLNIDQTVLLSSTDGQNFNLPTTCKLDWDGMPADGTLSGGWLLLNAPGVHSYSLSGSKLDFTAGGTYNLGGSQFGASVELVNSSGSPVTVQLPLGASYTNTGPNITVELPSLDVVIAAPALIAGSRVQLYNVTDGLELLNTELPGLGLAFELPYVADKVVRLRADHATKLPLETVGVLGASGLTFLDVQQEDDVYLSNGIDGSTVIEFSPDGANIEVDIDDPDGLTNVQRLYAWMQWYMTTEAGVRSPFFGAMSALDSANYQINQAKADIKLDNVGVLPVRVVGGYLYRRDGSTVISATSNSIQIDPGKAYAVETGVSGLTSAESAKLERISLLALETTAEAAAKSAALAAALSA